MVSNPLSFNAFHLIHIQMSQQTGRDKKDRPRSFCDTWMPMQNSVFSWLGSILIVLLVISPCVGRMFVHLRSLLCTPVSPMFVAAPPNVSLSFSRCRFCLTPHLLVKNWPSTRKCCFNAPMPSSTGLPPGSGAKVKDETLIAMASQRWCWQGVAATKPCNSTWEVHGIRGSDGKRKVAVARSLVGVFGTRYETDGWFLPHLASSFPVYYICFLQGSPMEADATGVLLLCSSGNCDMAGSCLGQR